MQCEYCDKVFTHRANLSRHQKTAKYCIDIQRQSVDTALRCEYCNAGYTRLGNLNRHYARCSIAQEHRRSNDDNTDDYKKKYEDSQTTIQLLQQNLISLQEDVRKLMADKASAPSSGGGNFNMVVNNLQPVSEEGIQEQTRHLTLDFILDGASGFATFANNYALAKQLLCTDRSRKKIRYKDAEGNIVDDAGGIKITQTFFKAIAPKNTELINREYAELQKRVAAIANSNSEGEDLQKILSKSIELQNMLKECNEAAEGKHNELSKEFIAHLTRLI